MDKWAEAIGPEALITHTCCHLEVENPELRDEGLKWIIAHKDGIKGAELALMVKPLCDCLSDKVSKIRVLAEEIIVEVMAYTGFEPFGKIAKTLKPAVQQAVLPILEKAKSKAASVVVTAPVAGTVVDSKEESKQGALPPQQKRPIASATPKAPTLKQPPGPTLKVQPPSGPTLKPRDEAPQRTNDLINAVVAQERPITSRNQATNRGTLLQAPTEDDTMLIVNAGNKEKRA